MGLKYKIAEWLICQRNYHSKGNSEIDFLVNMGWKYAVVQMYFSNYLKVEVPWYIIVKYMIGFMMFCWLFGFYWNKWGGYIIESEWGNQRNKFQIEMRKKFNLNGKP